MLVDRSESSRALRQVSPFAGALSPHERWQIRREVAEQLEATLIGRSGTKGIMTMQLGVVPAEEVEREPTLPTRKEAAAARSRQ